MSSKAPKPYRSHDFIYDPLFVCSGPKDYIKEAVIAKMSTAKYQVCTIFMNMFSDLPNHPRKQYVMRKWHPPPTFKGWNKRNESEESLPKKQIDIRGSDRCKFFHHNIPKSALEKPFMGFDMEKIVEEKDQRRIHSGKVDVKVQTQYREESCQTLPWEPPYTVVEGNDPELLKLDFLKWASGLPAGMHEIKLIQRARTKRMWEKKNKNESIDAQKGVIEAMERDEWAFREKEIEEIQKMRLALLEQMLNEIHQKSLDRNKAKLGAFIAQKHAEMEEKLKKIKRKTNRELRKIVIKEKGINRKYTKVDVFEEHASHKSEIYAPIIRFGENPKRWHHVIDENVKKYKAQFVGIEAFSTLPRYLKQAVILKDSDIKLPGTRLCERETKWTASILKELYEELKEIHKKDTKEKRCSLLVRKETIPSPCITPEVEGVPDSDEYQYQACVTIQSFLRGRSTQMILYEGRDRCRQLIEELRQSCGLLGFDKAKIAANDIKIRVEQTKHLIKIDKIKNLEHWINQVQGNIVGTLIDFLNKELKRLLDERRAHALAMYIERERNQREAAEAGRRQKEIRRRQEHDEMFKQILKIQQESVDIYLEDIIKEGMNFTSDQEARDYIQTIAQKIDDEVLMAHEELNENQAEEMVTDLVYHVVLPEVEKSLVRRKLKLKQMVNLRAAHKQINNEIENLYFNNNKEN